MSSKNVKFSKDSDTSGSRTSSHVSSHASSHASHKSSRGHRRSDSESLSDYDSRGSVPEGAFSPTDYAQQRLREALHNACAERDEWKAKAHELGDDLANKRKDYSELDGRWRAIVERNEIIEQEKKKLHSEKKALQEDKKNLQEENAQLKTLVERLERKLNRLSGSPPSSSIPVQENPDKANAKVRRSSSRSTRERALSEAEQAEKDKARLSKRFERSDESSDGRSDGTGKTERRRRRESTTYIEPMGPPAARPTAPVPPSPTRHYQSYTTSPTYAPQYTDIRPAAMSSVPRSAKPSSKHSSSTIHPKVLVHSPRYDESPFHPPDEDGSYFPHPLPNPRERSGR
jgi:hypothetical protein